MMGWKISEGVTLRWQLLGDVGEDWCWKPGLILDCSADQEEEEEDMGLSLIHI